MGTKWNACEEWKEEKVSTKIAFLSDSFRFVRHPDFAVKGQTVQKIIFVKEVRIQLSTKINNYFHFEV